MMDRESVHLTTLLLMLAAKIETKDQKLAFNPVVATGDVTGCNGYNVPI